MIVVRLLCWRRRLCASLLFVAALCAALAGGAVRAEEPRFFRIGTAATAGTFFEIGAVIASAISSPPGSPGCGHGGTCGVPGLVAVAQTTQGSIDNLRMINAGQIESGFSQADTAGWAYKGAGNFTEAGAMPRLRAIASLFPESLHIVVRADSSIRAVEDLKGKKISLGETGSGTAANARAVLDAAGLGENAVSRQYLRPAQAITALREGTIDALFMIGANPLPIIRELAAATPIRLVPVDGALFEAIKARYGPYGRSVIAAGSYPGVDDDTPSIALSALWLAGADVDTDLVYAITKSLWNEATQRLLTRLDPIGRLVRADHALDGITLPLHPGAERFYREIGLPVDDTPRALEGRAEDK